MKLLADQYDLSADVEEFAVSLLQAYPKCELQALLEVLCQQQEFLKWLQEAEERVSRTGINKLNADSITTQVQQLFGKTGDASQMKARRRTNSLWLISASWLWQVQHAWPTTMVSLAMLRPC